MRNNHVNNLTSPRGREDVGRGLNFAEKVERSLRLIREAYEEFGDRLVVANSLGKDSCVVWDLGSGSAGRSAASS